MSGFSQSPGSSKSPSLAYPFKIFCILCSKCSSTNSCNPAGTLCHGGSKCLERVIEPTRVLPEPERDVSSISSACGSITIMPVRCVQQCPFGYAEAGGAPRNLCDFKHEGQHLSQYGGGTVYSQDNVCGAKLQTQSSSTLRGKVHSELCFKC